MNSMIQSFNPRRPSRPRRLSVVIPKTGNPPLVLSDQKVQNPATSPVALLEKLWGPSPVGGDVMARQLGTICLVAYCSLFFLNLCAAAQLGSGTDSGELVVRIVSLSNHPLGSGLSVELLRADRSVASVSTDDLGQAKFDHLSAGTYAVKVWGPGLQAVSSPDFHVGSEERPHMETVQVQADSGSTQVPPTPTISKVALRAPAKAVKEFDRGNQAFAESNINGAIRHLQKAIELYPEYAAAYNNLGSAFARNREWDKGIDAYHNAIRLDDHLADAYVNLARVLALQNKYSDAESLLAKDLSFDPLNSSALMLISSVELRLGKYDECLSNLHKLSTASAKAYPFSHYIAAVALRAKNDIHLAVAEYDLFLKESPLNPYVPQAKAAVKELRAQDH